MTTTTSSEMRVKCFRCNTRCTSTCYRCVGDRFSRLREIMLFLDLQALVVMTKTHTNTHTSNPTERKQSADYIHTQTYSKHSYEIHAQEGGCRDVLYFIHVHEYVSECTRKCFKQTACWQASVAAELAEVVVAYVHYIIIRQSDCLTKHNIFRAPSFRLEVICVVLFAFQH